MPHIVLTNIFANIVRKFTLTFYWQKFRENKVFTKKKLLLKELISQNISLVRIKFSFLHCATYTAIVWKNEKNSLTKRIFRQINSVVVSQLKTLLSQNLCEKCERLSRSNFLTVCVPHSIKITKFYFHGFFTNFPSNQRFTKELYCKSI